MALTNLGAQLSETGRRDDALARTQEAVTLHRQLAQANPAAHTPDLAGSLANLGTQLAGAGRREEALATGPGSRHPYRAAGPGQPRRPPPRPRDGAEQPRCTGCRRRGAGRRRWRTTQEAVTLRRQLAQANPAAHLPDLAASLANLGTQLAGAGRREEALAPAQEAVTLNRKLAQANPAAHTPSLAACADQPRHPAGGGGAPGRSAGPAQEAVTLNRKLAQANPAAHLPNLAMALTNLGAQLAEAGRREDALARSPGSRHPAPPADPGQPRRPPP